MKGSAIILLVAGVLLLSGCFTPTPYQPKGYAGGYTDFETQPGIYYVSFRGNGYTSKDTVVQYWHRRVAEICKGRDRYEIVSQNASITQNISGTEGQVNTINQHSVEGYIRCKK
jgi:hypothetical protein